MMVKRDMKEADTLRARIAAMEHLTALVHGNLKQMNRSELDTHMGAVATLGWKLPHDVRMAYMRRRADDLMGDLKESSKKSAAAKAVTDIEAALALLPSSTRDATEATLSARQIWDDEKARIVLMADNGEIAEAEMETEISRVAEALGFSAS